MLGGIGGNDSFHIQLRQLQRRLGYPHSGGETLYQLEQIGFVGVARKDLLVLFGKKDLRLRIKMIAMDMVHVAVGVHHKKRLVRQLPNGSGHV